MKKSLVAKVLAVVTFAALTSTMLFTPMQASAKNGLGGGGVHCFLVLVSFDPATGTNVWRTVCSTGGGA
jgi:hypothetical protein